MHSYSTQRIKAYRTFKSLDPADPLMIVRHYERNEKHLNELDSDQWFDCIATYTDALFEAEMYRKHLVMAEHLLEVIILQNFTTHHGEDIYQHTLLRKACTHSHLGEHTKAKETIETLIRINPKHKAARLALAKLLLKSQPSWYRQITTWCIAFILISSCLFALSGVLYLLKFSMSQYPLWLGAFMLSIAILVMAVSHAWHVWQSYAYPRHLTRQVLRSRCTEQHGIDTAFGK